MERKFESDLASRIVEGKTRRSTRRAAFLLAAVAVCAMLGATTLYSVAMSDDTGAPMTEIVIFNQQKNELTETFLNDEGVEEVNVLATRTMSLKVKGDHAYAGPNCVLQNAKFVYVLNVGIQEISYQDGATIAWEGMELGELTLPDVVGDLTVSASPVVTRIVDGVSEVVPTTGVCAVAAGNVVTVSIPALLDDVDGEIVTLDRSYEVGDSISISVNIQTLADLDTYLIGEDVTEVAWGDVETRTETIALPIVEP